MKMEPCLSVFVLQKLQQGEVFQNQLIKKIQAMKSFCPILKD